MFNANAEIFVVLYSFGAGGRFIQLCLENKNYDEYARYLSQNINAHANSGHYRFTHEFSDTMPYLPRYVFGLHPDHVKGLNSQFLRQCKNLNLVSINVTTEKSQMLLEQRRIRLGEPPLCSYETSSRTTHGPVCKFQFGRHPILQLELEDYWDPKKAIPILDSVFTRYNINPKWKELYQIWHANAIQNNS